MDDHQKSQQHSHATPTFMHDTPPRSDVDEILRRKRKAREYKACYPCRQRKVKCDQTVPCKTCVVREHPELCSYHPPSESHPPAKRISMGMGLGNGHDFNNGLVHIHGGTVTLPREDWERICDKLQQAEKSLGELKNSISSVSEVAPPINGYDPAMSTPLAAVAPMDGEQSHVRTQGIHTRNDITGQTIHIGPSSVPALVMALGRGDTQWAPGVQDMLGKKSMLPIFGLDNESATYPFVDLWGLPHGSILRANELANALPSDSECLSFFRCYRETAHVVYPAVSDIEGIESDLLLFLINRASAQGTNGITDQQIYGKDFHWIGLVFAVLASGCQCSTLSRRERELTSQVYICCSFECLRFTNFLSLANIENIQTLLILGNVISNNMNAGVAWSLMGLTVRLSQTLGLHRMCPPSMPVQQRVSRSKVWWALLWQDSLLSVSYDRASSTTTIDHTVPLSQHTAPGTRTYVESMYRLCKVGLDIVRERQRPQNSHDALIRITEHRQELQEIMVDAADYLKDSRRCRSMRDQLEHWALYLHISYITSELCRPAISPSTVGLDLSKTLKKTCIDSLTNTVEAFLGLQNMTPFATRSWAAVHRSLSSALLLGIIGEQNRNERARNLLQNMIQVLGDFTKDVDPAELASPITRSVSALERLLKLTSSGDRRMSETGSQASPTMHTFTVEDINQALNNGDGGILSQSPLLGLDLESSPYALMESIVWGAQKAP
ncbi:hypothetical protein P153DRAFT_362389 [Dothidotthia symphoricarpi CBS 119687]|uniref:Zn(2)-C6 fungal-type domain-containing protein n=1 Tax=Dothidotthia symphoricarpi CBS 119687 TaxID=1392245 RepID=A0A6A6AUT8_9PLEO|nr:uncharacterized protein P153DRAFT_362389 [Dothidotthia symphoricarpi CBS 119687]KAF2134637.1 hypothetical protein P153DRAFT_362389 [Dothidotthia symphoricarpi CBS 119687]